MKRKVLGSLVLVFLFVVSLAQAGIVNVPPTAFRSYDDAALQLIISSGSTYGCYIYKTSVSGYLYAPVHLPDGVILKNMRVMYWDSDVAGYIAVYLYRVNMYNGNRDQICYAYSTGNTSALQNMVVNYVYPASLRLVNNAVCEYYVGVYFGTTGSSLRLMGIAFEY